NPVGGVYSRISICRSAVRSGVRTRRCQRSPLRPGEPLTRTDWQPGSQSGARCGPVSRSKTRSIGAATTPERVMEAERMGCLQPTPGVLRAAVGFFLTYFSNQNRGVVGEWGCGQ